VAYYIQLCLYLCNLFLFCVGLVFPHDYKLPFGIQRCSNEVKFSDHGAVQLEFRRVNLPFASSF
jgi:hypothetical protein